MGTTMETIRKHDGIDLYGDGENIDEEDYHNQISTGNLWCGRIKVFLLVLALASFSVLGTEHLGQTGFFVG